MIATGYAAGVPLEKMERVAADTSFADFGRYTPSWLGLATNKRLEGYLARMEGVLDRKREEKQVRSLLGNYIRAITGMQFIRRLRTLAVEKRFRLRIDG